MIKVGSLVRVIKSRRPRRATAVARLYTPEQLTGIVVEIEQGEIFNHQVLFDRLGPVAYINRFALDEVAYINRFALDELEWIRDCTQEELLTHHCKEVRKIGLRENM